MNRNDFDVKFAAFSKIRNIADFNQLPGKEIEQIHKYYEELRKILFNSMQTDREKQLLNKILMMKISFGYER